MDSSLDEILAKKLRQNGGPRRNDRGTGRGTGRDNYPRDGVRKKSYRHDRLDRLDRNDFDRDWVHDKFKENDRQRGPRQDQRDTDSGRWQSPKLRVENIHWSLAVDDLEELFNRIGPVVSVDLEYDRAGRSEGIAYVVYESANDAKRAVREYDGANAKGQPIYLYPEPGRSLAERIGSPRGRPSRSRSPPPPRYGGADEASRRGVDRYVPRSHRSRSPSRNRPQRSRRPGGRRDAADGARTSSNAGSGRGFRPRKTQEELDAEMEDYFATEKKESGAGVDVGVVGGTNAAAAPGTDDIDMIE